MNEPIPIVQCPFCPAVQTPFRIVVAESVIGSAVCALPPFGRDPPLPLVGCPKCGNVFVLLPELRR